MKQIISFKTLPAALCCLLIALAAWSCTADTELLPAAADVPTPADDPAALNFIVGPRPAFTEGAVVLPDGVEADAGAAPATRVVQTADGAKWEEGDVIWLRVSFYWTSDGAKQKNYISALRYTDPDGDGICDWCPFTVQDSIDYQTDGIKAIGYYSGFVRHPRWPAEAFAEGSTDAEAVVVARYFGKGIPVDGVISIGYTVDRIGNETISVRPGNSATINLKHDPARLHVAAGAKLELTNVSHHSQCNLKTWLPGVNDSNLSIDVPTTGGDYFVDLHSNSEVTLDGIRYTLAPGKDANGNDTWTGMSYTLTPVKNSGVAPGSD